MSHSRRNFFQFLAGVAVLAVTDPLKLIPAAEAVPGATAATALAPIVEVDNEAWQMQQTVQFCELPFMDEDLADMKPGKVIFTSHWADQIQITPPEERHGS